MQLKKYMIKLFEMSKIMHILNSKLIFLNN